MNTENSIYALNTLIEINNDRIECYENASKETEESDLKDMFWEFQKSSQKIKAALVKEIQKMGGTSIKETKKNNVFLRILRDIRTYLTNKDRDDILSTCEYYDFVAVQNYNEVLNNYPEDLSAELQKMLVMQQSYIKADHDKVKYINDMMLGYK